MVFKTKEDLRKRLGYLWDFADREGDIDCAANEIWKDLEETRNEVKEISPKVLVSGQLEAIRKDFCLWYYAQSQPLDAHKVVDWFASNLR